MAKKKSVCRETLRKHLPKDIPDEVINIVVEELEKIREGSATVEEFRKRSKEYLDSKRRMLLKNRIEFQSNMLRRVERRDFYNRYTEKFGVHRALGAINAKLAGSRRTIEGGGVSAGGRAARLKQQYRALLRVGLESKGLVEIFTSRALDKNTIIELSELNKKSGKPGTTGDSIALEIARIVKATQDALRTQALDAGIDFGKIDGYSIMQTHNDRKLRSAGYKAWKEFILPKLDIEKTFGIGKTDAEIDEFLTASYRTLTEGKDASADAAEDGIVFLGNYANRVKELQKSRSLHFKDAENFFEYNQKFGRGGVVDAVFSMIDGISNAAGMAEVFGTNYVNEFHQDLKYLRRLAGKSENGLKVLGRNLDYTEALFSSVAGTDTIPGHDIFANVMSTSRAVTTMALLGKAIGLALTDFPMSAVSIKSRTGENLFSTTLTLMHTWLQNFDKDYRKTATEYFGLYTSDYLGQFYKKFDADQDVMPGAVAKMTRNFFKFSLLEGWTEWSRRAAAAATSKLIGNRVKNVWGDLDPTIRASMEYYGINEAQWNIIRNASGELNGQVIVAPELIRRSGDSKDIRLAAQNLHNFLIDMAEMGSPQPSHRERAFFIRGTRPGTITGEAFRAVSQFKSTPLKVLHNLQTIIMANPGKEHVPLWDVLTRKQTPEAPVLRNDFLTLGNRALLEVKTRAQSLYENRGDLKKRGDVASMTQFIIGTALAAYVGDSMMDIAANRTPQDPLSPDTWVRAFVRGGSMGIYGDFIVGEYHKSGKSFTMDVLGPQAQLAEEIANLYSRVRDDDAFGGEKDLRPAAKAVNMMLRYAPGANLFYLRPALDYLILDDIQENLNPGFKRRKRKRERDNGRNPILDPDF